MHIVHLCSHKHLKDQKMLGELSVIVFEPLLKGVMSIISKKKKKTQGASLVKASWSLLTQLVMPGLLKVVFQ